MMPIPAAIALTLLGWADISVQPNKADRTQSGYRRSVAGLDKPSERTGETLRRFDLDGRYRKDPERTLATLEREARARPDPDLVYALAELSWIEGKRLERWRKPNALDRYLDAVCYSYDFLFDPELAGGREPSDPRFRLACELYNGGLDRLIRAAQSSGRIEPGDTISLKVNGKEQVLRVALRDSPWKPEDVDQLLVASDFEVTGLAIKNYSYGLGVPLVGIRKTATPPEGVERFYPPELAFPLTAFLRPNSRLRDPGEAVEPPRECTLELIDPVRSRTVGEAPATMPVETDLSTPLATMWSKTDLSRYRWTGLLRPGEAAGRAGLMLVRPYEPGKIPVVMVHGLASSPLAWVPMLNDLLSDPKIQQNYQFMLYLYPTGIPVPIAAAGLRDTLREAEATFNPGGTDPAFARMVLLGHSMGGLLSHAMAVRSDDRFWELNSDRRFEEILGPPAVRDELKRYLFFEALPFVRRVVFLATPHRGSDMSRGMVGRVGSNLITEPDQVGQLLARLIKDNPDAFDRRTFRRMPTSIETLDTDSPVLLGLLGMTPGPDVTFHSIVGASRPGPLAGTTDGVVSYRSAHIDGVKSERVVRSDHAVQRDPEAVLEVRRILHEHLGPVVRAARAIPDPIVPVRE